MVTPPKGQPEATGKEGWHERAKDGRNMNKEAEG